MTSLQIQSTLQWDALRDASSVGCEIVKPQHTESTGQRTLPRACNTRVLQHKDLDLDLEQSDLIQFTALFCRLKASLSFPRLCTGVTSQRPTHWKHEHSSNMATVAFPIFHTI